MSRSQFITNNASKNGTYFHYHLGPNTVQVSPQGRFTGTVSQSIGGISYIYDGWRIKGLTQNKDLSWSQTFSCDRTTQPDPKLTPEANAQIAFAQSLIPMFEARFSAFTNGSYGFCLGRAELTAHIAEIKAAEKQVAAQIAANAAAGKAAGAIAVDEEVTAMMPAMV